MSHAIQPAMTGWRDLAPPCMFKISSRNTMLHLFRIQASCVVSGQLATEQHCNQGTIHISASTITRRECSAASSHSHPTLGEHSTYQSLYSRLRQYGTHGLRLYAALLLVIPHCRTCPGFCNGHCCNCFALR